MSFYYAFRPMVIAAVVLDATAIAVISIWALKGRLRKECLYYYIRLIPTFALYCYHLITGPREPSDHYSSIIYWGFLTGSFLLVLGPVVECGLYALFRLFGHSLEHVFGWKQQLVGVVLGLAATVFMCYVMAKYVEARNFLDATKQHFKSRDESLEQQIKSLQNRTSPPGSTTRQTETGEAPK